MNAVVTGAVASEIFKESRFYYLYAGSRFSSMFDRGVVVLDIAYCYPEDSGSYVCVASNKAGRVESSPISLT